MPTERLPIVRHSAVSTRMSVKSEFGSTTMAAGKQAESDDPTKGPQATADPQLNQLPFLRWAGSKRRLLPTLQSFCPQSFERYVEPFAGSACLFFLLQPRQAIIGDFNQSLIETYTAVARSPRAISNRLATFPTTSDFYYSLRKQSPSCLTPIERAARFIYLNRFCFNGVYRTNRNGEFNVPRGTKTGQLPTYTELKECASVLSRASFVAGDFEETLAQATTNDFVYLDPPYSLATERNRGEYGYGGFSSVDMARLQRSLAGLHERGATFILSYRCTNQVRLMFAPWHQKTLTVRRHVAGFAVDRRNVRELLISNIPLVASRRDR